MKSSRVNWRRALKNRIETEWLPGPSKTGLKILTNLKTEWAHPWKHRNERIRKTNVESDYPTLSRGQDTLLNGFKCDGLTAKRAPYYRRGFSQLSSPEAIKLSRSHNLKSLCLDSVLNKRPPDYYVASHRACLQGENVMQEVLNIQSLNSYSSHDKL